MEMNMRDYPTLYLKTQIEAKERHIYYASNLSLYSTVVMTTVVNIYFKKKC